MEALIASYGDTSSDSDSDSQPPLTTTNHHTSPPPPVLPPPPIDLLNPPNSLGAFDYLERNTSSRKRSFPHIEGNYALHVYIPVFIPSERKKELAQFLKKTTSIVQDLHVVDIDVPLLTLVKDEEKLIQAALGREFHISLGRTVPIRVHQIESVVAMLKQKLQFHKRYLIDFNKWEVFVNDDQTRTFLSVENTSQGLTEVFLFPFTLSSFVELLKLLCNEAYVDCGIQVTKQIQVVNEVYKLHNLPEFYKVSVH
ncbi:U6 snRNA phosphodiesterase-like protein [Tanacetum coccineum]